MLYGVNARAGDAVAEVEAVSEAVSDTERVDTSAWKVNGNNCGKDMKGRLCNARDNEF